MTLARGAALSAASGLVCTAGRAWVIADDRLHLACFRDATSPGVQRRLLPGRLPERAKARKAAKPDFECLLEWQGRLWALGSGSRPNRGIGVTAGARGSRSFSLEPLYAPLRERLGKINIEGGFVQGGELVLLQRGVAGGAPNAVARWPARVLDALLHHTHSELAPTAMREMALGTLDGVALGFTDGAALADGGWLFAAAAEDTRDSVADGGCAGSVVGKVDVRGRLAAMRRVPARTKVEGIAAQRLPDGSHQLALVTDDDDPSQPAWLLRARW